MALAGRLPLFALTASLLLASHGGLTTAAAQQISSLFVFGDSFVDTGNHDPKAKNLNNEAWLKPYGREFPGKPAGRFSDGFVLTDYVGRILSLSSIPLTIRQILHAGPNPENLSRGVNFAFASSGVFHTYGWQYPPLAEQIDHLKLLLDVGAYRPDNFTNSLVLVAISGNDYDAHLTHGGSIADIPELILNVTARLKKDLKSLIALGFKKILVSNLAPVGCLPKFTVLSNFTKCDDADDQLSALHNQRLNLSVIDVEAATGVQILILDLFTAFRTVIQNATSFGITDLYRPCCLGKAGNRRCSDVTATGMPLYTVCSSANTTFFWDMYHPTHAGWDKIAALLKPSISRYVGDEFSKA